MVYLKQYSIYYLFIIFLHINFHIIKFVKKINLKKKD